MSVDPRRSAIAIRVAVALIVALALSAVAWVAIGGAWCVDPGAPSATSVSSPITTTPLEPDLGDLYEYAFLAELGISAPTVAGPASPSSANVTVTFSIAAQPPVERELLRLAGATRYTTALKASAEAFQSASTVVIATGENWPDALGGSALAGAVDGPLLLTLKSGLPDEVLAEIGRLGATKAYILGGTGAVGQPVEDALRGLVNGNVTRLGGSDRYGTSRLVAEETIRILGSGYSGDALVATGRNFPDATAGAAVASSLGRPIVLVDPASTSVWVPVATRRVLILGGTGAVPLSIENALKSRLGVNNVKRAGGDTRYETAVSIAEAGIAAGMTWDGAGIATGENFPDALAGGAMLGSKGSVLLLTTPAALKLNVEEVLESNRATIDRLHIFGGIGAVSVETEQAVRTATGIF